jgi:hypothetical protein
MCYFTPFYLESCIRVNLGKGATETLALDGHAFREENISRTRKVREGEAVEERIQEHAHNFLLHQVDFQEEFVVAGRTVNTAYYCDVLRRLRENVRRFRPELRLQKNWLLQHDNISSHTSFFGWGLFDPN